LYTIINLKVKFILLQTRVVALVKKPIKNFDLFIKKMDCKNHLLCDDLKGSFHVETISGRSFNKRDALIPSKVLCLFERHLPLPPTVPPHQVHLAPNLA